MKKQIIALLLSSLLCPAAASAGDIYVSPDGDDRAKGTAAEPLKTVDAALRMAREWRRLGSAMAEGGIDIILRGGVYRLDKPVFIRPEDSGTPASPTIVRGADGQTAVISGGADVTGWRKADGDARLPEAARGKVWVAEAPVANGRIVYARQLYADGRKAVRATQFAGPYAMERMKAFTPEDESITIPTPETDLSRAGQIEMIVHQRWAIAILRVREMRDMGDGTTKVWFHQPESRLEFAHPWPQPVIDGERGSSSFTLVNALELLDSPGEWYQDYPSGRIYYYPEDGKTPDEMDITVPALETLVEIAGTRERQVSGIRFDNISFEHAAWTRPSREGHVTLQGGFRLIDAYKLAEPGLPHKAELENQAWIARPEAAVTARFATGVAFTGCRFSHVGATALDFSYAVSSSVVDSCTFADIGGTAVMAGSFGEGGFETHIPYSPAVPTDVCRNLKISRCTVSDATNEDWGCAAVSAGYVSDMTIEGNEVSGVNYSGICVGWGWTARESCMRNNRIVGNYVHDYARMLYDAGGIYTLSNQPGSVIGGNRISLPAAAPYATNARAFCIYFDEATDGFTVEGNDMPRPLFGYNKPGPKLIVKDK